MHHVIVNEQCIAVADDVVDALREDILDAVRRGGAFVEFSTGSPREIQLLITGQTPVQIQRDDSPVEQAGDDVVHRGESGFEGSRDVDCWLEWQ